MVADGSGSMDSAQAAQKASVASVALESRRAELAQAEAAAKVAQAALDGRQVAERAQERKVEAAKASVVRAQGALARAQAQAAIADAMGEASPADASAAAERAVTAAQAALEAERTTLARLRDQNAAAKSGDIAAIEAAQECVRTLQLAVNAHEDEAREHSASYGRAVLADISAEYRAIAQRMAAGYAQIEQARGEAAAFEAGLAERLAPFAAEIRAEMGHTAPLDALRSFDALASFEQFLGAHYAGAGHMAPIPQDGHRVQMLNIVGRVGMLEQPLVTAVSPGARHPSVNVLENRRRELARFTQAAKVAAQPEAQPVTSEKGA